MNIDDGHDSRIRRHSSQLKCGVNWLASFDWPYIGMYLPPLPEGTEWASWYNKPASTARMDYGPLMEEMRGASGS